MIHVQEGLGTTEPPAGTYYGVPDGAEVTITAIPGPGEMFWYWTRNGVSLIGNPLIFTIHEDTTVLAYFREA